MDSLSACTVLFVITGLLPEGVTFLPRGHKWSPQHPTNGVAEDDEFCLPQAEPGKGLWKAFWSGSAPEDSLISQSSVLLAAVRRDRASCWKLSVRVG